uniref:Tail length tape measure protein n=1 Tax=Pectobacterium phage Pappous TaxID=3158140 RepID=A0AB39ABS9_9CAUD
MDFIREFGGDLDDYLPECDIHPDFEQAFDLFCSLATQWRVAFGGAVGLDYNVIPMMATLRGFELTKEIMDDLQIMEMAALHQIKENQAE